jgi:arylsulfatase A-like enzyme
MQTLPPNPTSRRIRLTVVGVALLLTTSAVVGMFFTRTGSARTAPRAAQVTDPRPNIVLILSDDQRWDEMGTMPIVDSQIVDKGVSFTNSFVVNPLCCPSRTTILTGKYSHSTRVYWNRMPHGGFPSFEGQEGSTIATWLHDAGYQTGLVGKYLNLYTPADIPHVPAGWDDWKAQALPGNGEGSQGYYDYWVSDNGTAVHYGSDAADYSTDVFGTYATDFINSTPPDKPLFLYFAPHAPHYPSTPPPRYQNACPGLQPLRPPSYNEQDISDKPAYIRALPLMDQKLRDKEDLVHLNHCRSLLGVDDVVGNILTALQDSGRLSNTLILYASDNGIQFGEHRLIGKKVPYEESIRVPIVIRYDPITNSAPRSDDRFALNVDFAQTFADAAGVAAPGAKGRSLLPLLPGDPIPWRRDFLIEHWEKAGSENDYVPPYCAVRNADYIYVEYNTGEEEVYDLQNDPYELQNVASDGAYAAIKRKMHKRLLKLCQPPPPNFHP